MATTLKNKRKRWFDARNNYFRVEKSIFDARLDFLYKDIVQNGKYPSWIIDEALSEVFVIIDVPDDFEISRLSSTFRTSDNNLKQEIKEMDETCFCMYYDKNPNPPKIKMNGGLKTIADVLNDVNNGWGTECHLKARIDVVSFVALSILLDDSKIIKELKPNQQKYFDVLVSNRISYIYQNHEDEENNVKIKILGFIQEYLKNGSLKINTMEEIAELLFFKFLNETELKIKSKNIRMEILD